MNLIIENRIVSLVTFIQFVFVIDFMMVAPLGPDLVQALGAENSAIGIIVSSYTFAAAISSLFAAKYLDLYERRRVVVIAMTGLGLSTIACAFTYTLEQFIFFRFVAGLFAGPAAAMAIAMIIDVVPNERRGKAMGKVMSAFSIASIMGIPIGLQLSLWGGWGLPFFVVGGLSLLLVVVLLRYLPEMRLHLIQEDESRQPVSKFSFFSLFYRKETLLTFLMTVLGMIAAFLIIPNIAAFMLVNLAFPREYYGVLYLIGGVVSLIIMRLSGHWVDSYDPFKLSLIATGLIIFVVYFGFYVEPSILPVYLIFMLYMSAMSMRNVVSVSVSSMIPAKHERAAFSAVNQSVSHFSIGIGAFLSSIILTTDETGKIFGMSNLAIISIVLSLAMPVCIYYLMKFANYNAPNSINTG